MNDLKGFRNIEFKKREKRLIDARAQVLIESRPAPEQLHIVYVMTHVGVCGGTKIILEHANNLVKSNQSVTLVAHFDKPEWFLLDEKVLYVQVPFEEELAIGIPECDLIVATYWREIYECIAREIAPVVYFEQGDYHLFDWENVSLREKSYIYKQFQLVPYVFTVSNGAADQIKRIFHKDSNIINNAIDKYVFNYDFSETKIERSCYTIMMIGSESNEFKRIQDIKEAYGILQTSSYNVRLVWVTPDEPVMKAGEVVVNPKQKIIGDLLREADIFVCASIYESFSLPVLEAMASGCAVITTANKGVLEYAVDRINCVMIEMRDPAGIAKAVNELIDNVHLRNDLIARGIKTAQDYTWDRITPKLIAYYREIARFSPLKTDDGPSNL